MVGGELSRPTSDRARLISGVWGCFSQRSLMLCAIAVPLLSGSVRAQSLDPASTARFRLGPLGVSPVMSGSTGLDTNVFNDSTDPKSDVTYALTPRVQAWLRLRRLVIELNNSTGATMYREYRGLGGVNVRNTLRLDYPINRFRLFMTSSFVTTEERANLELDARVRHRNNAVTAGVDIRSSSKTVLRVSATRMTTTFDEDARYQGVNLASSLNRRAETAGASWRYALTGVTTVVVLADTMRERFESSAQRNSTSIRVTPGVEFQPRALLNGSAYVGYRQFSLEAAAVPDFTGLVASAELSSTIRGDTRVTVRVGRDVSYSFSETTPYYVQTGGGVTVSRRLAERWDGTAHMTAQSLGYRSRAGTGPDALGRSDSVRLYGGGVNYRVTSSLRLGVAVDRSRRASAVDSREYSGTRVSGTFDHVF
jgi:hypothetical protein